MRDYFFVPANEGMKFRPPNWNSASNYVQFDIHMDSYCKNITHSNFVVYQLTRLQILLLCD